MPSAGEQLPITSLARLAIFWFGIQALWGALLGISIQARCAQIAGAHALGLYGEVATSGALIAACTQLIVGPISDRRHAAGSTRAEFYVTGAVLGAVALLWFYRAQAPWSLLAAYAAVQAGLNVAIGPYQAVIPDVIGSRNAGTAAAWMGAFQGTGNAAGALLATLCRNQMLLAASLGGALLLSCALTLGALRSAKAGPREPHSPPRLTRAFAFLWLSRLLLFAGFYTILGYLYFYVEAFIAGVSSRATSVDGIFILLFTMMGAAGAVLAGRPSDRFDRRNVATTGALAVIVALAIFVVGRSFEAACVGVVAGGLGWGVFLVADWAIACRVIPAAAAAGGFALWNLAVIAPQILAPLAATVLLGLRTEVSGRSVSGAFILAGVEMALGVCLLWRLPTAFVRE